MTSGAYGDPNPRDDVPFPTQTGPKHVPVRTSEQLAEILRRQQEQYARYANATEPEPAPEQSREQPDNEIRGRRQPLPPRESQVDPTLAGLQLFRRLVHAADEYIQATGRPYSEVSAKMRTVVAMLDDPSAFRVLDALSK